MPNSFYRLKMMDLDERFTYSRIIHVKAGQSTSASTVSVNPVEDIVIITIGSDQLMHTKAILADANGRLLQSILITSNAQPVSLGRYAPGIYFLKMENGEVIRLLKK
jgi:hypothetical protein